MMKGKSEEAVTRRGAVKPIQIAGPTVLHVFHYLSTVQITRSDCVACVPLSVDCTDCPVRLCCMCPIICRLYRLPGPTVLHVFHYLSTVQITPSSPSPSHSATDGQSFRFNVKISSRSALLGGGTVGGQTYFTGARTGFRRPSEEDAEAKVDAWEE
jgi:hypothetical protein